MNKTNALRILDSKDISYEVFEYDISNGLAATEIAKQLNEDENQVFKTLVCVGKSNQHYVFVIPSNKELNLKFAAEVTGEKYIEMILQKELLPLTGYIHGGCSPIAMKKQFPTFIDESAILYDYIYVSAGKVGMQIKINPDDLIKVVLAKYARLTN